MNAQIVPHINHVVTVPGAVVTKDGQMTMTADALKLVSQ
jgi:hypothetical protein